jgi:hypothetical protein
MDTLPREHNVNFASRWVSERTRTSACYGEARWSFVMESSVVANVVRVAWNWTVGGAEVMRSYPPAPTMPKIAARVDAV